MKNNEKRNYISDIGKKLNIIYGNVFIKHKKKNKKLFLKYLREHLDNYLLNENEKSKNSDIFKVLTKKRAKIMSDVDDDNDSIFNDNQKYHINTSYKYHQLHLEKIERLKTSHFKNEIPRRLTYDPNYNLVKKKIITGPKWNSMTGRKSGKKIFSNNSFSQPNNLIIPTIQKKEKKEKIKIQNFKTITKNYSSNNISQKLKKIAKNLIINKSPINIIKKPLKKIITTSKSKKVSPKKEIEVKSVFPQLYTPQTIYLKENDIKDKNLKHIFLINTSPKNNIVHKKLVKSYTKIFRNNVIGLNNEQIKAINEFRNLKNNNLKTQLKKLKTKKTLNKKYNLSLNNIKNDFCCKKLRGENSITGISNSEKSFNYLINKSLIDKNNKEIIRNNYRSLFLDFYKFKKNREFYKYDADKIYDFSFSKLDNKTFRDVK